MKAYKGFNEDLRCRDFQYEVGKEYEENRAELCECGFHACVNPIDVFNYYSPADSRYCEVELSDVADEESSDSKRCGKRIKINAEIGIKGIVDAFVKFTLDRVDWKKEKSNNTGDRSVATNTGDRSVATNTGNQSVATNTGDRSVATNTGDQSAATNTGDRSAATNTGDRSVATNTGNQSAATNTGNWSAATNTGDWSAATNTGNWSAATNTGDQSAATNTGDRSAATNTGDWSAATVEGKESIAIATGIEGRAKGALGCYIVLSEWKQDERGEWHIIDVKSAKVDGENIKANTFYMLKNGEFEEVRE